MAESGGEKKHAPTERRRQRAREEGRVVRSTDLNSAILLLAALAALYLLGGHAAEHLAAAITDGLSEVTIGSFSTDDATYAVLRTGGRLAIAVLPMLIAMMVIGVLVNVSQTGLLLLPSKVAPSLQNISPATGLKRIWSVSALARFAFGILKMLVVGLVAYAAIRHYGQRIMTMAGLEIPQIARTLFDCLLGTCLWIGGALFALALIDYGFQRWKHERDLMMTDEELKEEIRESEGDPAVANRRKQIQQRRSATPSKRSGAGQGGHPAANADLVITAPSGIAVALRYNSQTMTAPVVIAKGSGDDATSIENAAAQNGVRISSNPLLAQHQYRSVAVGSEIPLDQYAPVANLMRNSSVVVTN
ncbi:MAG: EscU/YscU/HrcU family type III secretion system export apparatus switch protein [Pirellulaceae bacterium]